MATRQTMGRSFGIHNVELYRGFLDTTFNLQSSFKLLNLHTGRKMIKCRIPRCLRRLEMIRCWCKAHAPSKSNSPENNSRKTASIPIPVEPKAAKRADKFSSCYLSLETRISTASFISSEIYSVGFLERANRSHN